ncbi:MAG: transporter ATP-binding protein [Crocinitomicaceae bacterium]|jgi:ABC-2 type transport system ATP-binding protein|nr:transporter ATP-binding protein [Crocinitomicaceae bacterium]
MEILKLDQFSDRMEETILEISNLKKVYKDTTAVRNLSISVQKGQVFGLLGPNGSGKTTTLGIILGVLRQTSGSFSWFGNGDKDENRKRIGALLETPNFYPYLSAWDNLVVVAKIKGMTEYDGRIEEILKRVNLYERRKSKFKTFSLGMKQRLALASTMINDPDIYVLDEPTNGLDPEGIAEIRTIILEIAKEGKTIIIASHILDEIEKVCTHAAILRKGELLQTGSIREILTQERLVMLKAPDLRALAEALKNFPECGFVKEEGGELLVSLNENVDPSEINKKLSSQGIYLSGIKEHRKNLESTFLEIIKDN